MTEPGTGSYLQNIKTKAVREGDDYLVSGSKTFITNGSQADLVLTVVKTDPDDRAAGISLMLVPTSAEGFSRGRVLDKIGMKGQDTSDRKSVVEGKSVSVRVDLGGRRIIKKKRAPQEKSMPERTTKIKH